MAISTFGGSESSFGTSGTPRSSPIALKVQFRHPETGAVVDPAGPKVRLTREDGQPVSVQALGVAEDPDHTYTLLPNSPPSTGLFRFSFLPNNLPAGLYKAEFFGTVTLADSSTTTIVVKGSIGLGEISLIDDMINRLRTELFDTNFWIRQYQLDAPIHQWNVDDLYVFLQDATEEINLIGPRSTGYTLESLPSGAYVLAIDGAKARALDARARFEKANEMDYSDQHTLSIKRADFYAQQAEKLRDQFAKRVESWKRSTPPRSIGLGNQRLPFRIQRVIGLLPGFETYFPQ